MKKNYSAKAKLWLNAGHKEFEKGNLREEFIASCGVRIFNRTQSFLGTGARIEDLLKKEKKISVFPSGFGFGKKSWRDFLFFLKEKGICVEDYPISKWY